MGYSDDLERRRQEQRDYDRGRAEFETREWRRQFEMEMTTRITHNPEALGVLHGLEDKRIIREIMGVVPEGALDPDDLLLDEEAFKHIRAVQEDPSLSSDDRMFLTCMWVMVTLDRHIKRLESESAMVRRSDRTRTLDISRKIQELQEKRKLMEERSREILNQSYKTIQDLLGNK
jgi:hypothetical protein